MINQSITAITRLDIEALVTIATPEGKTLEYKRQLPGTGEDFRKVLRIICSLANSSGGDLIYGIEEANGVPVALPGIEIADEDALKLRLESAVRDGIQPRIPHLNFKILATEAETSLLIIRVQKSWNGPHRLTSDGHFYGRNAAGSYPLDVGELRQAFTLSESVIERIRNFRTDRLLKIDANAGPLALADGVTVVFHMVPFSAFFSTPPQRIDLSPIQRMSFDPMGSTAVVGGLNLDGYYRFWGEGRDRVTTYCQLFRSGVVESVCVFPPLTRPQVNRPITPHWLETELVRMTTIYRNALNTAGVGAPFIFFLSFLKVKGSQMVSGGSAFSAVSALNEREADALILPEVVAETDGFDVAQTLKPLFDTYWNAYGYEGSRNFNESGAWEPRP